MNDDEIKINLLKNKDKEKTEDKPDTYVLKKSNDTHDLMADSTRTQDDFFFDLFELESDIETSQESDYNKEDFSFENLFDFYERTLETLESGFPLVGKSSIEMIPNELSAFFLLDKGKLFSFNPFTRKFFDRPIDKMILPHTVQNITIYDKRAALEVLTILYSDIRIAEELTAYVLFSSNKICLRTQRSFDSIGFKDNQISVFENGCAKPNLINSEFDLVQISSNEIEWQPE